MEKCREKVETAAQQTELLSEEAVEQMSNQELLFLSRESGDEELKWKLVLRMTGMVRAIAAQVWGIYSSFAQLDDIVEEGILVLLSAVDKFDPSKDVKFETYVSKRLRGMIVDLARHQDWLPRQVRQKSIRLNRAREELSMQMGRTPSSAEMADHLGVTREEYGAMLSETAVSGLLSFEALLDTQGRGARQRISGESGNPPEELCEEQELHETLKQGISSLREKEQLVLSLYYEKELSMKEIAQVLNVSAPRISQIHSRAIEHLRQYMKQYMEAQ